MRQKQDRRPQLRGHCALHPHAKLIAPFAPDVKAGGAVSQNSSAPSNAEGMENYRKTSSKSKQSVRVFDKTRVAISSFGITLEEAGLGPTSGASGPAKEKNKVRWNLWMGI